MQLLWVKVLYLLFLPKIPIFCKKNADISKIKSVLVLKDIFSKSAYACVLTYQVGSV